MSPSSRASTGESRVIAAPDGTSASDRPVLLCLAGAGCPPWIYDGVAAALPDLDVVVYDYFADEGLATEPTWRGLVDRCSDVVEAFGRPTHLVGHSMGAGVALDLLGRRPPAVRSATICATGLDSTSHKDRDMPRRLVTAFDDAERRRFVDSCVRHATDDDRERLLQHLAAVDERRFRSLTAAQRAQDLRAAAARIDVPVVVCHGLWDARRSVEGAVAMRDAIADARLLILDSGHTPMLEAPREVVGAIQLAIDAQHDAPATLS